GHTDAKGMPHVLQLALSAREFSDVIVFRSPPLAVQRALFGALAPIARWCGYRATYPQLSRTVLAPREEASVPRRRRAAVRRPLAARDARARGTRILREFERSAPPLTLFSL